MVVWSIILLAIAWFPSLDKPLDKEDKHRHSLHKPQKQEPNRKMPGSIRNKTPNIITTKNLRHKLITLIKHVIIKKKTIISRLDVELIEFRRGRWHEER